MMQTISQEWAAVAITLLLASVPVRAQQLPSATLSRAEATSAPMFDHLSSARELSDGRLIVAALRPPMLSILDVSLTSVRDLLRSGRGPSEYSSVSRVHPMASDSTLIEDRQASRWIVLAGDRAVSTRMVRLDGAWNGLRIVGADREGRVLEIRDRSFAVSATSPSRRSHAEADTMVALAYSRNDAIARRRVPVDTIAQLIGYNRALARATRQLGPGSDLVEWWISNPFSTEDQAILFEDGWIALALVKPYRVDWIRSDGERILGSPISFEPPPVTVEWKRQAIGAAFPGVSPPFKPEEFASWPTTVPPFLSSAVRRDHLFRGPHGELIVERVPTPNASSLSYDVVSRRSKLVCRLQLAPRERMIGTGAAAVIVARLEDDDLESVTRYPWPKSCGEMMDRTQ